jgi:citrate lyase subunit gamma (acyl carrier protein)
MRIQNPSCAGAMESNDILIMLHPSVDGVQIQLESRVKKQFGRRIESVIRTTLAEVGVTGTLVIAQDKGALDYTIKSRVITAVNRSLEGGSHE